MNLTSLQSLARKQKADITFYYDEIENMWWGKYNPWGQNIGKVSAPTLTKCINKLYERVRRGYESV